MKQALILNSFIPKDEKRSTARFLYPYRYRADTALVHETFSGDNTIAMKQGS